MFLQVSRTADRMGENKLRRRRHARILNDDAKCIYCGGAADTVEHMPPAILFRYKQRPNGLEFPSCEACNVATSHADLIAAFFTRLSDNREVNGQLLAEASAITTAIQNNIPDSSRKLVLKSSKVLFKDRPKTMNVLDEINKFYPDFVVPGQAILHMGGPIVKKYIDIFSAKMGFALYYQSTGSIVPSEGGVTGTWKPNLLTKLTGIPPEFRRLFGEEGRTLSQGTIKVSDQFKYYAHVQKSEAILGIYMARLLDGLTIFSFASSQSEVMVRADEFGWKVFRPGDFKAPPKT